MTNQKPLLILDVQEQTMAKLGPRYGILTTRRVSAVAKPNAPSFNTFFWYGDCYTHPEQCRLDCDVSSISSIACKREIHMFNART